MRKFGKSIITFVIILSPILIMGRPIVGRVEDDLYSILGLNENSSADDVLQAYYRLRELYNSNVMNDIGAQMRFQKITEAYDVLSDVEKRRQYDYQRRSSYQPTINFGFPNGNFPFGQQYTDGNGGNAYVWTAGNPGGGNNYAWSGGNGWGVGNGMNNAWNGAFPWGGQGGGSGGYGGGGSGGYAGAGGNNYANTAGSGSYAGSNGNGGSAWVVGGGDGASAWAAGGRGGAGGTGGATVVSGGGGGEATYESYTINGCTTVTKRMGDSVASYTTCD